MARFAIRQAVVVPPAAMVIPMLVGVATPGYSSISQQISELDMAPYPAVVLITRLCALLSGLALIVFAFGLWRSGGRRFGFTILCTLIFGASMASAGVFLMGSPWHTLSGFGLFQALAPACFAAEWRAASARVRTISMLVAMVTLFYLWLLFVRFDPSMLKGLTQRIGIFVIFGWYSFASFALLRAGDVKAPARGMATAD